MTITLDHTYRSPRAVQSSRRLYGETSDGLVAAFLWSVSGLALTLLAIWPSLGGHAVLMYPDSLGQSVKSYEMSEAEAQRRRIDFRTALADTERQLGARARAASNPCGRNGKVTNCY
jgi:hypothetical protein